MLESDCQIGMVRRLMREADKEREREWEVARGGWV